MTIACSREPTARDIIRMWTIDHEIHAELVHAVNDTGVRKVCGYQLRSNRIDASTGRVWSAIVGHPNMNELDAH